MLTTTRNDRRCNVVDLPISQVTRRASKHYLYSCQWLTDPSILKFAFEHNKKTFPLDSFSGFKHIMRLREDGGLVLNAPEEFENGALFPVLSLLFTLINPS